MKAKSEFLFVTRVLIFLLVLSPSSWSSDWSQDALRLTGESTSNRESALRRLRSDPRITAKLRLALHTDKRSLALDVISALHYVQFLPELLEMAKADETGIAYLTINSFLTKDNCNKIISIYKSRLLAPETLPVAKSIFLDTYGSLGTELSNEQIDFLINQEDLETRASVLNYLRSMMVLHKSQKYFVWLPKILVLDSPTLRRQAIFLLREINKKNFDRHQISAICQHERQTELRALCKEAADGPTI